MQRSCYFRNVTLESLALARDSQWNGTQRRAVVGRHVFQDETSERPMMWLDSVSTIVCVTVLVQIAGLASMAIARISECSGKHCRYQGFFFASMLLVGLFSALMIGSCTDCSLFCAFTLPVMVVGATMEMRPTSPETPF